MEEQEKIYKDIELRSEEVQEVMNQIPPWILRSGITTMFIIVLLLLAGSWFFKYPDVIQAQITVTSLEPPASIIARATGRIDEIYVENNQKVEYGTPLRGHCDNSISLSAFLIVAIPLLLPLMQGVRVS